MLQDRLEDLDRLLWSDELIISTEQYDLMKRLQRRVFELDRRATMASSPAKPQEAVITNFDGDTCKVINVDAKDSGIGWW